MDSLIEMGFPSNACKRAMYFSDGNIEAAMNWLCSHMDDPDYNTGTSNWAKNGSQPKFETDTLETGPNLIVARLEELEAISNLGWDKFQIRINSNLGLGSVLN